MREGTRLPGVSAEELLAVVEAHLDRVHDAVRRLGCDGRAAVEVVETSALDLVDAVADRPETVPDAVGWWLAAARRLGLRVGQSAPAGADPLPVGGGLLSADDDQLLLSEALEELPEPDRAALLLRDSYALPVGTLAAALGTDAGTAMGRVGRARLAFLGRADDEPALVAPAHVGALDALARLGETRPGAPDDAVARKHARTCAECAAVVAAQRRAHLMLAGLTVVALAAPDRAAVLERVGNHAHNTLPATADLLVHQDEEWDDELAERWFSPALALLGLVAAVLLGLGGGVLLDRLDQPGLDPGEAATNVLPPVTAPPVLSPAPGPALPPSPEPPPTTRVFEITPSPSPPPPPPSSAPAARPTLLVEPASGPNGAVLTVRGTGWEPGGQVELAYLSGDGTPTGSVATASADERGVFQTTLTANDPAGAPGRHLVRADDGTLSTTAPYDVVG